MILHYFIQKDICLHMLKRHRFRQLSEQWYTQVFNFLKGLEL
jgi:hypothetical protein